MPRRHAYEVEVHVGRKIGFGLVIRDDKTGIYSVQFRDVDGAKLLFRSTAETARPRALAKAEQIIKAHHAPPIAAEDAARQMTWDELLPELERHLVADKARPATVRDYLDTIRQVRTAAVLPAAVEHGAAQRWVNQYLTGTFTRAKAKDGAEVKTYTRSPRSAHARVRKLSAIWSKYLTKRLKVVTDNPWASVDLPKLDALPVRTLSGDRVAEFFAWVDARWMGWELPRLFWEVKAVTGCRLFDLCSLRSADLDGGTITFQAEDTKGRRSRIAVLPVDLFAALKALAGPTYLWESYSSDMPAYLKMRGVPTHRVNPVFSPERMSWWAKDETDEFNKQHADRPKIQSHDFRKRVITEAHRAGVDVDTAASGAGMSSATARGYYLAMDQKKTAAELAAKLADALRPKRT